MQTQSIRFVDLKIGDKVALPTALPGIKTITTVVDLEAAYGRNARYRVQFTDDKYMYVNSTAMVEVLV